jgi:hypothetical protein
MKFQAVLWLLFMTLSCSEPANRNGSVPLKVSENNTPVIFEFEKEIHNFGTLSAGEVALSSFAFTNSGEREIKIEKIVSECPCLSAASDNLIIHSGGKGKIDIKYNTSGLYGRQLQMIRIIANGGTLTKELAVTADILNNNISYQ